MDREEKTAIKNMESTKRRKRKMKTIIGYTTGVYDMFHIGHLNILRRAKEQCDFLIVGVSTDELVEREKHKTPVIPFAQRCEIVSAIRYVDKVVPQTDKNKLGAWENYRFDKMFVGSDWKGPPNGNVTKVSLLLTEWKLSISLIRTEYLLPFWQKKSLGLKNKFFRLKNSKFPLQTEKICYNNRGRFPFGKRYFER